MVSFLGLLLHAQRLRTRGLGFFGIVADSIPGVERAELSMGCQPWGGPFSAALALPLGGCVPYHSRFLTSLSLHFLACREGVDNDACIIASLR